MASILPHATGWRAFVALHGTRQSRTFRTKREAVAWAAQTEAQIARLQARMSSDPHTLREALERYRDEVSPKKRSKYDKIMIARWLRSGELPVDALLVALSPEQIGRWRDTRLQTVKPGTVIREMGLLRAILNHARVEWRWLDDNPAAGAKRPPRPRHRERVISWREIRALLRALDYRPGQPVALQIHTVGAMLWFALHTGMRAGEIGAIRWAHVRSDHVHVPKTKTGVPRDVPLTPRAAWLLAQMPRTGAGPFPIPPAQRDALFRKYRDRAGVVGVTFHDARHTAATRLARRVDALTLCKIFGWQNASQALTYYNPSASDIAAMLGRRRG